MELGIALLASTGNEARDQSLAAGPRAAAGEERSSGNGREQHRATL